jgi:predicted MFS family arabinose efflux permease
VLVAFFTLATPFYIGLATERLGLSSGTAVRNSLLMQTIGNVSGSLLYARVGDHKTVWFIRVGLILGVSQPVLALLATGIGPAPLYFVFMVAGLLASSLEMSFLNWVVMYATPDQRPVYSGLFNSVSAVALLIAPVIGGVLVEAFDYEAAFIVALVMVVAALFVALRYGDPPGPQPSAELA